MSNLSSMFATANVAIPDEGPKCIRADLDFSTLDDISIEGLLATTTGTMSYIQGVYIDNADNANAVELLCAVTNQRVTCPAQSQGYFPLIITNPPRLTASTPHIANLRVKMFFYNIPIQPSIWGPDGTVVSGTISAINIGPTLTDYSNLAMDGTNETIFASGQAAHYLALFSDAANPDVIYVNLAGGDASTPSGVVLSPGGSITIESGVANAVTAFDNNGGGAILYAFGG
jgi:hypothetical protein